MGRVGLSSIYMIWYQTSPTLPHWAQESHSRQTISWLITPPPCPSSMLEANWRSHSHPPSWTRPSHSPATAALGWRIHRGSRLGWSQNAIYAFHLPKAAAESLQRPARKQKMAMASKAFLAAGYCSSSQVRWRLLVLTSVGGGLSANGCN